MRRLAPVFCRPRHLGQRLLVGIERLIELGLAARHIAFINAPTCILPQRVTAGAEAALNAVNKKEAVKEADPQSASMAKAIAIDQNVIAALSQAFFAIVSKLFRPSRKPRASPSS